MKIGVLKEGIGEMGRPAYKVSLFPLSPYHLITLLPSYRRQDSLILAAPPLDEPRARQEKGFTLIELMVVVAILGILVSIAVPTYQNIVLRARETVLRQNLYILRDVIDQFYADKGKYPEDLEALVSSGYIRNMPMDPITQQTEWETEEYTGAEEGQLEPTEGQETGGIWDVHSTAPGNGMNGTPYAEW